MLSFIHSRRVAHDLLVLAVLGLEMFFASRARLMYIFILNGRIPQLDLDLLGWLVFFAVGTFGFALATHRHYGVDAIWQRQMTRSPGRQRWFGMMGVLLAVGVVIAHDLAATIYTVGAIDSGNALVAVIGMCALVLLPFAVGMMSQALAEGIQADDAQQATRKIARWKQQAELRYWKDYYTQHRFQPQLSGLDLVPSAEEDAQEEITDPNMEAITSSGMPKWLAAEQVASMLNIPVFQAESRMNPKYRGKYERIKSREFIVQRKPVRKAYYKTVEAIAEKENVQVSA